METQRFDYKGDQLVCEVHGEGDRVLVYLHGLLMDSRMNQGIATALAERGDRVVLLDLLGHGRSDKRIGASAYRMDTYADQVVACLDHLGIERAVVGGCSLGANVSLQVATRYPERVQGLVVEMPVLERATPVGALVFAPLSLLCHYGAPVIRVVGSTLRRLPDVPIASLQSAVAAFETPPEVLASILHGILVGPVAPSSEERAAIDVPVLVLAHDNDLIHPFNDAVRLADQVADGSLVRAHSAVELRMFPQRLTGEVAEFLDEVRDGADHLDASV